MRNWAKAGSVLAVGWALGLLNLITDIPYPWGHG